MAWPYNHLTDSRKVFYQAGASHFIVNCRTVCINDHCTINWKRSAGRGIKLSKCGDLEMEEGGKLFAIPGGVAGKGRAGLFSHFSGGILR